MVLRGSQKETKKSNSLAGARGAGNEKWNDPKKTPASSGFLYLGIAGFIPR